MDGCSFAGQLRALGRVVAQQEAARTAVLARAEKAQATKRARRAKSGEERIVAILEDGQKHLANELMRRTGLSRCAFYGAISRLINKEVVVSLGTCKPRRYQLARLAQGERND